jgi:hypothetical protein
MIEFRGYPLFSGSEMKGEKKRWEGRQVGIELQRSECLLHFSRRFTVLDLVKLKASTTSLIALNTFSPLGLYPHMGR